MSRALKSVNVVIVGDNTLGNQHLAEVLAGLLDYTPMLTAKILEQLGKCSLQEIIDEDGPDAFGENFCYICGCPPCWQVAPWRS